MRDLVDLRQPCTCWCYLIEIKMSLFGSNIFINRKGEVISEGIFNLLPFKKPECIHYFQSKV